MDKKFINKFSKAYDWANKELIELSDKYYKNGLPVGYINYYNRLMDDFNTIGAGKLLIEKNIKDCKKYFYSSAYMMKTIIENSQNRYDEEWGYDFWEEIDQLYFAILSDDYSLVIQLTKLIGNIDINGENIRDSEEKFVYYVMNFLKNYIQKNIDVAKECVKKIKRISEKDLLECCLEIGDIFEALLCKNSKELSNKLNLLYENNKINKIYKGTFKQILCIEGLALAKLAIINGIDVELDKSTVGIELLEKINIDYPKIEIIY